MVGSEGSTWASSDDWETATFGESGAPSAPEGSSDWYAGEIAAREAAAAANTESNPTGDGNTSNDGFYQDPRTGEMYANKTQFLAQNPTGVSVPVWSTPGVPVLTPSGEVFYSRFSQYDMDPAYDKDRYGVPSLAEQERYSRADYARDFAGDLLAQYENISPAVAAKSKAYQYVSVKQPVPQRVPEQAALPESATELVNQASDIINKGANFLANNLLIVVIVIAGLIVLPRLIPAASGGR